MKIALCYRGKCLDSNLNSKTNKLEEINYKKSLSKNLDCFKDHQIDVYLHGWIKDPDSQKEIIDHFNPKAYILETQIDFSDIYNNIPNFQAILFERFRHLESKPLEAYNTINYHNYFQNIFSYAYSISKSLHLCSVVGIEYDLIISLRYDCVINKKISLSSMINDEFIYVNNEKGFSHIHIGDWILAGTPKKIMTLTGFYSFLSNKVYHNPAFKDWVEEKKTKKNKTGRYNQGIYSNQVILSYFLDSNQIPFEKIKIGFESRLNK